MQTNTMESDKNSAKIPTIRCSYNVIISKNFVSPQSIILIIQHNLGAVLNSIVGSLKNQ